MPIDALVLAAGQGRRFGGAKLHALYRGRPLLSYVLDVVRDARQRGLIDGGHVVIAAGDDRAATLSTNAGLGSIINHHPELGLSQSVRLGLAALEAQSTDKDGAALMVLGDQPLLRVEVIEAVVARWREGGGEIIRPRYDAAPEVPGHPVLLARSVWPAASRIQGDHGFGSLLHSSRLKTGTVNVAGDNPDIDTGADLDGLKDGSR